MTQSVKLNARHRWFRRGFAAINGIGADRWLRPFTLGSGMILMFHHVRPWQDKEFAPNAALEITPEFLALTVNALRREGIDIISLDDVPDRLSGNKGERPFAVLTFDDGYRNNLDYAAPLLQALDVPWTLYVVDEFASGRGNLWWLELEIAITAADELSVFFDGQSRRYKAATVQQKYAAFEALQRDLKAGSEDQLHRVLRDVRRRFDVDGAGLVRSLCADWSELRSLAAVHPKLTIGAHTLSHPILARCNARKAEMEIAGSKHSIEERMGRPIRHFSFPHGDVGSAGAREFLLSQEAGYETAVTTRPGHIFGRSGCDLWSLPRVSINGLHQTESALRALLSGAAFLPQAMRRPSRRT